MARDPKQYHNGFQDRLQPLESIDLKSISDFDSLLHSMSKTAFTGRTLGEAADVLEEMVRDPECLVIGTFSGAMTIAKMGLIICDMIDWGWLDVIVTTGALMSHGLIEETGRIHFKANGRFSDEELFYLGYDRVYDTLELEKNLLESELLIRQIISNLEGVKPLSSEILCREIGRWLADNTESRGILRSAYLKDVPIYIPALTDSEIGLGIACHAFLKTLRENPEISEDKALGLSLPEYNPFMDLNSYAKRVIKAERIGIFTVGGGVPRNWAQQIGPYIEILSQQSGRELPMKRFMYGVRICPEPAHWGGLSGCTYSEGVSWGKFVPPAEGGRFAEVLCDATVILPILVKGVKERIDKKEGEDKEGKL
jgi:deoxyhypusine synthase